jgi:hypothetical protein
MPHVPLPIGESQLKGLLVMKGAALARWEDEFDSDCSGEWWHVVKDVPERFEDLSANTRSKIRRGRKRLSVSLCAREDVLRHGYRVYKAAYARYRTFEHQLREPDFAAAISGLPEETDFWCVVDQDSGAWVGFCENLIRDGACFYSTIWFDPIGLRKYAGYVLIHEMNRHYLNDLSLRYVSDGARSINHSTEIHEYLQEKFLFRKAYARLRIVYAPGVYPLICCLYPLRRLLKGSSCGVLQKLAVLLEQERIRRSFVEIQS